LKTRMSLVVCLLSVLAAASAYGQTTPVLGRMTVQQKFMVKDKEMPAGNYEFVKPGSDTHRLVLRNRDTGHSMNLDVVERLARHGSSDATGRVIFNSVGDQKILSEFWPSGNDEGYLLGTTKKEHEHETVNVE
jgi:hypothetical protein